MSNRKVAILLAVFGGFIGLQKFYLKKITSGVLFAVFSFTMIPFILSLLDAISFMLMSDESFDQRYGMIKEAPQQIEDTQPRKRTYTQPERKEPLPRREAKATPKPRVNRRKQQELKEQGIEAYRDYHFEEARRFFLEANKMDNKDYTVLFNLACVETQEGNVIAAYEYLSKAVAEGLHDMDKINQHKDLAELRINPYWDEFVKNEYKIKKEDIPLVRESLLDQLQQQKQKRETKMEKVRQIDTDQKQKGNDYSEIFG